MAQIYVHSQEGIYMQYGCFQKIGVKHPKMDGENNDELGWFGGF